MEGWPDIPEKAAAKLFSGDYAGFVKILHDQAENGDVPSMLYLGRAYQDMKGIPHDYSEAHRWYRAATQGGSGPGAWSLGCLYEKGLGTTVDNTEARSWFQRAADIGFRRTALSVSYLRWYPGPAPLTQSLPSPLFDKFQLTTEELTLLKNAKITGRVEVQGGSSSGCGLPARLIVIAQTKIKSDVTLSLPITGTLIYLQDVDHWTKIPENAPTTEKNIRLAPQDPEHPEYTTVTIQHEDGSETGGSAFVWRP